jgi:hypothetical protein
MGDPQSSRRAHPPLLDTLGKLCVEGKQSADYLWQVPDDAGVRQRILEILDLVEAEARGQGRREMPQVALELKIAARASPSPQQVDLLVNGFDRLYQLWEAAKSGLI